MNLDFSIFSQINNLAGKYLFLDALAIFFAKYLGYILIFFLILFLLKNFKKYWKIVVEAFGAAILARLVIVNIIRQLWYRPRPFLVEKVNLLLLPKASGSFPSGHAAFYFALSTLFFLYNKKIGSLFLIASFLISVSRVFVGIHWPSDIIAGAACGIFSGWLIMKIFKR